jgi:hypothetical protein
VGFNYASKTILVLASPILPKLGPPIDALVARQWSSGNIITDNGNYYEIDTDYTMPILAITSIILSEERSGTFIFDKTRGGEARIFLATGQLNGIHSEFEIHA